MTGAGAMEAKGVAQQLYDEAFPTTRDPRSPEYRAGVMAALRWRCEGIQIRRPYAPGTAAADAWFAGLDEGHAIWRRAQAADGDGLTG